jgi:hypothetical protein
MRIFITGTGRCGTKTLANACKHITNYTSGHETRARLPMPNRLNYPDNHIEVDNRLIWFLDRINPDDSQVWRMSRNLEKVFRSFMNRPDSSIIKAVRDGIFMNPKMSWTDAVYAYLKMEAVQTLGLPEIKLEEPDTHLAFWDAIKAEGDKDAFLAAMKEVHNAG